MRAHARPSCGEFGSREAGFTTSKGELVNPDALPSCGEFGNHEAQGGELVNFDMYNASVEVRWQGGLDLPTHVPPKPSSGLATVRQCLRNPGRGPPHVT